MRPGRASRAEEAKHLATARRLGGNSPPDPKKGCSPCEEGALAWRLRWSRKPGPQREAPQREDAPGPGQRGQGGEASASLETVWSRDLRVADATLAIADFDGDGLDAIVVSYRDGRVEVLDPDLPR